MFPRSKDLVQFLARTLRSVELSMAVQFIVWCQFLQSYSLLQQQLGHVQLSRWRCVLRKGSDESNAKRAPIVSLCMRSLRIPSPALVHCAIPSDHEIVADIVKVLRLHVEVLDVPHTEDTGALKIE